MILLHTAKATSSDDCVMKSYKELKENTYHFCSHGTTKTGCELSNLKTHEIKDMHYLFADSRGCPKLTDQNLSGWDVSKVTNFVAMFLNTKNFAGIGLQNWNTKEAKDLHAMFDGAKKLGNVTLDWNTRKATDMHSMFKLSQESSFEGLGLQNWYVSSVTNFRNMFDRNTITADLSNWDMSTARSIKYMFKDKTTVKFNLDGWDLCNILQVEQNLTDSCEYYGRLPNCGNLRIPDSPFCCDMTTDEQLKKTVRDQCFGRVRRCRFSNLNTSKIKSTKRLFDGCTKLEEQDLSSWDVSQVTNMHTTFFNARNFKGNGIENWNTGKVTTFRSMFEGTKKLENVTLAWDTSKATTMEKMFYQSKGNFEGSGLEDWDVSSVTNFNNTFRNALNFKADLTKWDMSSVEIMDRMFHRVNTKPDGSIWNLCGLETESWIWPAVSENDCIHYGSLPDCYAFQVPGSESCAI